MTLLFLAFAVFSAISEPDLLPLDQTVVLDPGIIPSDEVAQLIEASELVFTVKSVTRRVSNLGYISERYDLEIGRELKGDLPEETVYMYTLPVGMYSNQFSSLTEGAGLIVFALTSGSQGGMESLHSTEGNWIVCLYTPISE